MNSKMMLLTAICLFIAAANVGCSNFGAVDTSRAETIYLDRLGQGQTSPEDLLKKVAAGQEFLICVSKGQTMPVKLELDFPFLKTVNGYTEVEFTEDTYLLVSKSRMLISRDGRKWEPVYNLKGIKKLYGARQGSFDLGFAANDTQGPYIDFKLKME